MSEHTIDMPKIESAIHPQRILQLFMRPKQYFQDLTQLDGSKIYLLAYLLGVFLVMDRIDTQIIKIQMMQGHGYINDLINHWLNYWGFILIVGMVVSLIAWHLYGWWYEIRLQWSGVTKPDKMLAKQVNVLQWMIFVIPILLVTIVQTFVYKNYYAAYNADETWTVIISLLMMVYSCVVSFIAAKTIFQVNRWGIFWFLILPLLFYSVMIITIAMMFLSQ